MLSLKERMMTIKCEKDVIGNLLYFRAYNSENELQVGRGISPTEAIDDLRVKFPELRDAEVESEAK
jgi:hypothetical protein